MTVYTVHEPPDPPADRLDRAEQMVFVRDGFSWAAAWFPPLFFASRKDWSGLLLYLAAAALICGFIWLLDAAPEWMTLAILALGAFIGFEASTIERWALDRDGYDEIATVSGHDLAECERRFFDGWLGSQPILTTPGASISAQAAAPASASGARARLWQRLLLRKTEA